MADTRRFSQEFDKDIRENVAPEQPVPRPSRSREEMRRERGLRNKLVGAAAILGAIGLVVGTINPFDWDINPFDNGKTTTKGTMEAPEVEVRDLQALVVGDITARQSISLTRTIVHFGPLPNCEMKVEENKIGTNGRIEVDIKDMAIAQDGDNWKVSVKKFEDPVLTMPIEEVLPTQAGDLTLGACVQKSGGERFESPENVIEGYARQLLGASSQRIGECVLNKANDEGSAVNQLLSDSIAESVAAFKGVNPSQIIVNFDYEDRDDGLEIIAAAKTSIAAQEEENGQAEVDIDTLNIEACELQEPRVILSDNIPSPTTAVPAR